MLQLLRRQRPVRLAQEETAVADDRRQRRAQLVTHHGKELRLQLVEAPKLFVDLGECARLAIFFGVVADHFRVVDEHAIAAVQTQEGHGGRRGQPVHDHQGRRRRGVAARPHPDRRVYPDGQKDQAEDDAERLRPPGPSSADGGNDQRRDAERRDGKGDIGGLIKDLG